jgi:hypothetical protein
LNSFPHLFTACHHLGDDICTLNRKEVKADEEWYVGVTCGQIFSEDKVCSYDIVLEYVEEIILYPGKPITFYLYEDEERIFRYFVPDEKDIKHVQISARGKDSFSKFQLLTVKGNDPPGTDRRKHSWPAWNNGYVSRFEPGCDCFCTNCNYTAMVQADTPGYYTIVGKTSSTIEKISGEELYDNVFMHRNNCYEYYVSNPDMDMRVKMKVYSGDPDLYIHPKELPANLKDFKYNSLEVLESEELVISKEMREEDENVVGTYYFCVQGKFTSSFKLEILNKDKSDHMLESGLAESGYLEKDQFINYWYREDILREKTNITFQLHAFTGSQTLRSKICKATNAIEESKDKCLHSKEDLLRPIPDEKTFVGIGKETVEHDPKICKEGNSILQYIRYEPPSCIYNVGVIGTSEGKSHYAVTVRHQEGHHLLLSEGRTNEGSVALGQYDYYKISINDDTISELTIQLLAVHGDPDLYVARNIDFPKNDKFEKKASICGRFPDTIVYNKKEGNLTGDYYIAVYGFAESAYHIYYHTERVYTDSKGNVSNVKLPIKLSQSKPVRGVLRSKDDYAKYKFAIGKNVFITF